VRNELDTQLTSVMGRKAAEAVQSIIQSSMLAESRTLALVTGSITLLLWVYSTSIILLTGAKLTQIRSRMRGMRDNRSPIPAR
jgi:uncharacterized BrkB/YihY/UPF0761 family membrane protein